METQAIAKSDNRAPRDYQVPRDLITQLSSDNGRSLSGKASHDHQMADEYDAWTDHASTVAKRATKIRSQNHLEEGASEPGRDDQEDRA
jgi:hypothetical protein